MPMPDDGPCPPAALQGDSACGSLRQYQAGCRRAPCRQTKAASNLSYQIIRSGPPAQMGDAAPARLWTQLLQDLGMPLPAISEAADVSMATLYRLLGVKGKNPSTQLEQAKLDRILLTRFDLSRTSGGYYACGVRRRVEALHCIGWEIKTVARLAGVSYTQLTLVLNGSVEVVTIRLHRRIAAFYELHSGEFGGSSDAVRQSIQQNYAPPDTWDEATIDDPALPDRTPEKNRNVNAIGVKRRLKALMWKGWEYDRIAAMAGVPVDLLKLVVRGHRVTVPPEVHVRICRFYAIYWLENGGSKEAKRRARFYRYAPPGAWEPRTIDDPSASPDPGVRWE